MHRSARRMGNARASAACAEATDNAEEPQADARNGDTRPAHEQSNRTERPDGGPARAASPAQMRRALPCLPNPPREKGRTEQHDGGGAGAAFPALADVGYGPTYPTLPYPNPPVVKAAPSSIMVAVPVPPFQHSPMLGHCASSHTVCRPRSRSELCRYSKRSPCGARWRSHGGLLAPGSAASCGPAHAGPPWLPCPAADPADARVPSKSGRHSTPSVGGKQLQPVTARTYTAAERVRL